MQLYIKSLASEIGTPFFVVSFEIREGALLHCEMKMALRNAWLSKDIAYLSNNELKVEVFKQLVNYLNSIGKFDIELSSQVSFSSDLVIGG